MDPSMLRLQEIAGTNKKSKIALDLNVGASTVTNWAKRGVSKEGALAAAEKYNADANYILSGMSGKPSVSDLRAQIQKMQSTTPPPSIDTPEGTKKVPVDYGMSGQMPVISWVEAVLQM